MDVIPMKSSFTTPSGLILLSASILGVSPALAALDLLPSITKGSIAIQLKEIATGLAAPDYAISPPGDTSRLFVLEQKGQILIVKNGVLSPAPALDIQSLVSPPFVLTNANDERGLLGLAFHPGFDLPTSPGFRTLYTFNSQPFGTGPTYAAPNGANQGFKNAVNEWKISATNPDEIDPLSRREVISFGKNANNHNGGTIDFGPDGYLYLGLGDGGNSNDVGASHIEPGGNSQNLTTAFGKMLRFDPLNPALTSSSADAISPNGQYRIPVTNPFQGPGQVPETYCYGLRNPYRFSFDTDGSLILADVGQNNVEEINRIVSGGNYGWPVKEGEFLFNRTSGPNGNAGTVGARSPASPAGMIDPISGPAGSLQYDHEDGISITGGFVYRGSRFPELTGKYIFGDLALRSAPSRADGRLFYADLTTGAIREFLMPQFPAGVLPNGLTVHGFGQDGLGELYALVTNTPSSGTGGVIYSIQRTPVIWNTGSVAFNKDSGADWTLPANQDRITDQVWLTRASTEGLFNIRNETAFTHLSSPAGTEWAYGTTANYNTLIYKDWETWTGGTGGGPPSTVGKDAVVHLIRENIYIDIKFTAWGRSGGQFSYVRAARPALTLQESWRQQFFSSPANAGNGADAFDFDNDGLINLIEYAFGQDPTLPTSLTLPQPQLTAGTLGVTFTQPAGVANLTYQAEWSPSLTSGSWTYISDTGNGTTHTFNLPAANKSKVFFRFRISLP